jgi:hypothetical protein
MIVLIMSLTSNLILQTRKDNVFKHKVSPELFKYFREHLSYENGNKFQRFLIFDSITINRRLR